MSTTSDQFPTEITGLPEAGAPELVELGDGDRFDLRIAPVAKRLGDATVLYEWLRAARPARVAN